MTKRKSEAKGEETLTEEQQERERAREQRIRDRAAAEQAELVEQSKGYRERTLANGTRDYIALHDQWTNPDENEVVQHVAAYRSRLSGVTF